MQDLSDVLVYLCVMCEHYWLLLSLHGHDMNLNIGYNSIVISRQDQPEML